MSATRKLDQRLRSLADIAEVMGALRNLATSQIVRLRRLAATQQRVVRTIEAATADFLRHYPEALPPSSGARPVLLLVGSERGFCGTYNDGVAAGCKTLAAQDALVVVVGRKLAQRLGPDASPAAVVEGPSFPEEVEACITRLAAALMALPVPPGLLLPSLTIVAHEANAHPVAVTPRRPFAPPAPDGRHEEPPQLDLQPLAFFRELADHYLFAALHATFYAALLAENEQRLQHLESALQRIERTTAELTARRNAMRQEEMTEEIEVILLSAGAAAGERLFPDPEAGTH